MGGPSTRTVADRQTSIQIQTSAYGICIPVVYGTNRIGGNLVWFANFQATDHTTKTGGKGMGGSATNTTYTYSASAILALAEGTIDGIGAVWKDKDKTDLSTLGLSLFTGADAQAEWAFLSGYANLTNFNYDLIFGYQGAPAFVDQSLNYSGTAYLASPSYDLGDSATVPNHTFEVQGKLRFSGGADALPSAIIPDILTAQRYGVGFPAGNVDALTSYQQYCQALGLFVSPAYTQARPGSDVIQELCDATNAAPVWSAGKLKIIPYGDAAATGNGATYTPNLTPQFDLSDDDFLEIEDGPIIVTRKTPADAYNRISVQFRNRANQYNQEVVTVEDQDAIEKYGLKVAPTMTCDFICDSAVAKQVAQLALQRQLYKRNEYEFELGARFPMLEPMDIVTLTDPGLGMDRVAVRLIEIEESDDGFRCIAEDLPIGVAAAATYTHDNGLRWQNTTAIPAGNCAPPVIFEMPPDQQATGLAVAIACGRQPADKMYGGCRVWLSLDGVNYKDQGVIVGSSRYGTTTAALPGVGAAGTDTTNTLSLSLRSGGQMLSGSAADMAKGTTLLNVGGEYLAYQNATLTGTNAYNLTTLNRGLYKTATGAKANGSTWVRVDDGILVMPDLDVTMIGQTVYIKVCSFNVYGAAEQSLASVSAYTYTITGNMKALESPADLASAIVGQGDLATTNRAALPFGANALVNTEFTLIDPVVSTTMPFAWTVAWQGNSSNVGSLGWNDRRVALGDGSYAIARDITGTPNGSVFDCMGLNWASYGRPRTALAVVPGDRVAVSALVGHQNCLTGSVVWFFYDENGVYLGEGSSATVAADIGAAAYSAITRKDLKQVGGTFTVPADGTYAAGTGRVRWIGMNTRFAISGSAANPRAVAAAPMMAKVPANQTALPPYTPGASDRQASYGAVTGSSLVSSTYGTLADADVRTANGTAAGIAGQAAWATYTGYTPAQVTTPGANLIFNSSFNIGSLGWADGSWNGPVKGRDNIGAYYMETNGNNRYLYTADVTKTPVFPNQPYTFQVWAAANGSSSGSNRPYFYIDWHRADGSAIGSSGLTFVPVNVGYMTLSVTGTAPADAAYARVVMNSNQVATGGGWVYTSKWKLEIGSSPTPWSDDATNGALYQSGQTIDSLKPAQANADVTGANVAAAIAGQAATATNSDYSAVTGTKPPSNATNGAPSGTPVGVISADDVAGTINGGGGGVATNKVATASVQPNAITTPASAYTAAATIVPNATPTNVQTMTISTTGAVVDLTASFVAYDVVGSSSFYTLEVRRDGTSIYTATIYCTSLPTPVTIALSDAPAAGSYTYTIRATVSGDPVSFANRLLKTLETKR